MTTTRKTPPDRAAQIAGRLISHTPEQLAEQALLAEERLADRTRILDGEVRELRVQVQDLEGKLTTARQMIDRSQKALRFLDGDPDASPGENLAEGAARIIGLLRRRVSKLEADLNSAALRLLSLGIGGQP